MFEEEGKRFAGLLEMYYRKGKIDGKEYVLSRLRKIKLTYDKADNKTPHSFSSAEYYLLCDIERLLEDMGDD